MGVTESSESLPMFSIVSPIVLIFIVLASFTRHQWHRLLCAIMIAIPSILHYSLFNDSTGATYYGSGMAFSAMAIALLQFVKPNKKPSQLVVHLQIISYLFLIVNIAGYFMWYAYMKPNWYDGLCLLLSILEAARLILHTRGDKNDGIDGRYYNFSGDNAERSVGSRS